MARKSKHDVVTEFRCSEILDAARKVFARKGYSGATVDAIAEAAGLAKGTLYLYFPSKREIYLEALKQGASALIDLTNRNLDAAPTPAGKIRAFITTRVLYAEENRDFVSIYHSEFQNIGSIHLKEFRTLYLRQASALEAVLRDAAEQGHIQCLRTDAAAFTVYEMTRSLISRRLLGWSNVPPEEDIEFLFQMIWRALSDGAAHDGRPS